MDANESKAGINMFRTIIILMCFVCFAGCTPVIERTKLENEVSLEEGPEKPGIDIVARCDFRATTGEKEGMFSNRSTCVFMENRMHVFTEGFWDDELQNLVTISYSEMQSVALYKLQKGRQLQIEAEEGQFIFQMWSPDGIWVDQELSESILEYLIAKGVSEKQATNWIYPKPNAGFFFIPIIPDAFFTPFIF